MTGPVVTDDIVSGCAKYLSQFPEVLAVLGADTNGHPYLFQNQLWQVMERTQSTAAMLGNAGGWAGPNTYNTARFPRLVLEITADPIRQASGSPADYGEARRRVNAAYEVIDSYLHRPQGGEQWWGDIRTIACARQAEPFVIPVPNGDGMVRLQVFYGVTQG